MKKYIKVNLYWFIPYLFLLVTVVPVGVLVSEIINNFRSLICQIDELSLNLCRNRSLITGFLVSFLTMSIFSIGLTQIIKKKFSLKDKSPFIGVMIYSFTVVLFLIVIANDNEIDDMMSYKLLLMFIGSILFAFSYQEYLKS